MRPLTAGVPRRQQPIAANLNSAALCLPALRSVSPARPTHEIPGDKDLLTRIGLSRRDLSHGCEDRKGGGGVSIKRLNRACLIGDFAGLITLAVSRACWAASLESGRSPICARAQARSSWAETSSPPADVALRRSIASFAAASAFAAFPWAILR